MNALPIGRVWRARLSALLGTAGLVVLALGAPTSAAAAAGTSLAFQTQPGGGQATVVWAQQPVVKVVDAANTIDTTSAVQVTLSVGNNPSGGTLTCSSGTTVAAVNGVARFGGCKIDNTGPGYTLIATAAGLSAATSNAFDITLSPPITANQLIWGVATTNPPPLTGVAGGPLNFTFQVHVADSTGTTITSGPFSTAPVTLAMSANGVGAVVTCSGGNTATAVAGVAQWTGCSVSAAGNGLAFVASAPGISPATSPTFNITAGGPTPTLTITASKSVILWGDAIDLTVHLSPPAGTMLSVAGRTVHIQVEKVHTSIDWTTINPGGDVVTDATGTAVLHGYTPATNLWYQALLDASPDLPAAVSADTRVVVRQLAIIKPDNGGTVKTITKGTTIKFRTVARPSRDDIPRTHVKWELWRLVNNHWTKFATELSDPDVSGTAFLSVTFNTGSWRIRSMAMPTQLNANSVWTPFVQYLVI